MKGIRCNECGLIDWDANETCQRCHAALLSQPAEVETAPELPNIGRETSSPERQQVSKTWPEPVPSRRKTVLVVAWVGLALSLASVPVGLWMFKRSSTPDFAKLIVNSSVYDKTVTIGINRECEPPISVEEQKSGVNIPHKTTLLPETLMLYHAGFLKFHRITDPPDQATEPFLLMNPYTIEPKSDEIGRQWSVSKSDVYMAKCQAHPTSRWWVIPVGESEFVEVKDVKKSVDRDGSTDFLDITFRWRWKPNDVGRVLDLSDLSYKAPEDLIDKYNLSDVGMLPARDSRGFYVGLAKLHKNKFGTWSMDAVFLSFPDQRNLQRRPWSGHE